MTANNPVMTRSLRLGFLLAAMIAYVAIAAIPWHADTSIRRAVGIVAAILILWISEIAPLGVTSLAIPVAAVFTGLLSWKDALASWGDPVVFLFLGAFLLARALDKFGAFDSLASGKWSATAKQPGGAGSAALVLGLSGLVSTIQNNTAVTAMLLPAVARLARRCAAPAIVLLALSYGSTFGGMATPVGTAPNFIGYAAMKKLDPGVSFVGWMRVGIPVWIGASVIGWAVLALAQRAAARAHAHASPNGGPAWIEPFVVTDVGPAHDAEHSHDALERRAGKRWALAAIGLAALLWLVPGIFAGLLPHDDSRAEWLRRYLPESLVPAAIACALFFIHAGPRGRPILDRHDFQALDWDTLFLIAGGMTLGRALESSGAAAALANAVTGVNASPLVLMLLLAGATVLLSELTSNTATASLMVPIAGALAPALGVSPVQAIWLVALSASLGFALPVSTPPNALVYGTRFVPLRLMAAAGIMVDLMATCWVVCCVRWLA